MTLQQTVTSVDPDTSKHYLEQELHEQVREDPEIFRFLENGSLDGLFYWDLEHPEHEWLSPRFKALFGYAEHEIDHTPQWWQANIHPDDLALALQNFEAHKDNPDVPYDQTVRYRHKDGSTVWVRCRGLILRDENDAPKRMLGAHTDVTEYMQAKAELAKASTYNQTIMDTVPNGLQLWEAVRDESGVIIDLLLLEMNRAAEDIVGRPRDQLVGRKLSETFPGNFEDGLFDRYRAILNEQAGEEFEINYQHEGLNHSFRVNANPNSAEQLVISFIDISDLRRAQASAEDHSRRYETLYRSTPVMMHSIDEDGRLVDVSDAWLDAMGHTRKEVIGRSLIDFLDPASRDDATSTIIPGLFQDGSCWQTPCTFVRKNGSPFEAELSAILAEEKEGQGARSLAVIIDVTDRNEAMRTLKQHNREVGEINEQLRQFTYIASHDLQEPLRKITSFAEMLNKDLESGDTESAQYALKVLTSSAVRSRKLVQDLLAYSRSRNREFLIEEQNLGDCVEAVVNEYENELKAYDISCSSSIPNTHIKADAIKLRMLFTNLIGNAIKYHDPEKSAEIVIAGEQSDEGLRLSVQDNGIGFDMAMKDIIFEPFKRLHDRQTYEGSGIGLAICATICERHGWALDVESRPGAGSTFTVFIPAD